MCIYILDLNGFFCLELDRYNLVFMWFFPEFFHSPYLMTKVICVNLKDFVNSSLIYEVIHLRKAKAARQMDFLCKAQQSNTCDLFVSFCSRVYRSTRQCISWNFTKAVTYWWTAENEERLPEKDCFLCRASLFVLGRLS